MPARFQSVRPPFPHPGSFTPGAPELRLLEAAAAAGDTDALMRVLADGAVEPALLGADVAHVLRWDLVTGLFEAVARAVSDDAAAGRPPGSGAAGDAWNGHGAGPVQFGAWELDALDPLTRAAWTERRPQSGPAADGRLPWARAGVVAIVPVRTDRSEAGLIILEFRDATRFAADAFGRFGEAARIATDARERAEERERRAGHAAGLAELTQTALAPRNIAEVLHLAARLAAERTGSEGAAVWAAAPDAALTLQIAHGPAPSRERLGRALLPVARAATEDSRPRVACPATDEFLLPAEAAADIASLAVLPVVAYGRPAGALGVWSGHAAARRGPLAREDMEFLQVVAGIVGLALDQARRFSELREAERRERDAARYARQRDALAALGELAARASREGLKPTASIRAFAARLLKVLPADDAARDYVEIIAREAERLERILREQREHADLAPPTLEMVDLNGVVETALRGAGDTLVRRRARVLKRLAPELPKLLLDRTGIGHVAGSLLGFALDSIAVGGRIRIETRKLSQHVLFELGHDGVHGPGQAIDQLFLPFGGGFGGGPGLSVAQRIIEQHGGELRVRADGEWTTVVTFTLPIVGNQDRRRSPQDRRRARDRRNAAAE